MADQTPTPDQPADESLVDKVVHAVEDALHSDPALAPHVDAPAPTGIPVDADAQPAVEVPVTVAPQDVPVEVPVEHEDVPPVEVFIDNREPVNVLERGNIVSDGPGTVGF